MAIGSADTHQQALSLTQHLPKLEAVLFLVFLRVQRTARLLSNRSPLNTTSRLAPISAKTAIHMLA